MSETDDLAGELRWSRAETRAAFENRALVYASIYEALVDEIGVERAVDVMRRAIRARGRGIGAKYRAAAASGDLDEVGRIFCSGSPCGGELFEPAVEERTGDRIVLRMTACPLLDAWRKAGLGEEEAEVLCEVASAVDEGTFEGAGLDLVFLDKLGRPGASACLLELRVPPESR